MINWSSLCRTLDAKRTPKLSQAQLEMILRQCSVDYHNRPTQCRLTDYQYDTLYELLEEHYPDSAVLKEIGAPILLTSKTKVQLPTCMPSMQKLKRETAGLEKWRAGYPGPFVVSDKLDGMSLLLHCLQENGADSVKAYTRGDGLTGQNVSWLVPHLHTGHLPTGCMVRGECIISKSNWSRVSRDSPEYKNARNFVCGYLGSSKVHVQRIRQIDFVAYEYIVPGKPMRFSSQWKWLMQHGWKVVHHRTLHSVQDVTSTKLAVMLQDRRDNGEYEVDGLIIGSDSEAYPRERKKYPTHAKAFKMMLDDQTTHTTVKRVLWEASRYGVLKPVVEVEPVSLDGVTIANVTGHNAHFIFHNAVGGRIGPGARLQITRSGGVIPKIVKVVHSTRCREEECGPNRTQVGTFDWNPSQVELVLSQPGANSQVCQKRVLFFFKNLGVPFLKEGLISRLFLAGHKSIVSILGMSISDYLKLDGVKQTLASKLHRNVQEYYDNASIVDIVSGTHFFGPGFGKKVVRKIHSKVPLEGLLSGSVEHSVARQGLLTVRGLQSKTVDRFFAGLPECRAFYQSLPAQNRSSSLSSSTQRAPPQQLSEELAGRVFAYTGFRPSSALKNAVQQRSGTLSDRLSTSVTDLLVKSLSGRQSRKLQQAKDYNIPVILVSDFCSEYSLPR